MRKVVITGSECTGKSTLAAALAGAYRAVLVPEYARLFVERKGTAPDAGDVEEIARGQMALEDELTEGAPDLLVLDTDLLSTWVYSCHYYGECPAWIGDELSRRYGDLYLLAGIDVPWVADGEQRDRGHRREEMQALFRAELRARRLAFIEVSGSPAERLAVTTRELERRFRRR